MRNSVYRLQRVLPIILLVITFLIYSTTEIFTKLASMQELLSVAYFEYFALVILTMGAYAVLWQVILKRVDLSKAYLFKSLTVVFGLFFAWSIFHEMITLQNIVGCSFVIAGIVLNSYSRVL